jgi:RNA polymerase sigma-70 factor (ECF subfamily)
MIQLERDFKEIYEDNYAKVMRLCMGYASGDSDLASDLTQEVFIKVWSNLKSFRKESSVTTWIYRIAVNTCLMNLRKKKSKPLSGSLSSEDVIGDEESGQIKERQYKEMYRCINTLSATNKAIVLMELEGMPQKEIAQVMGLKHEAIRTRVHRIKNELSKCVNHV